MHTYSRLITLVLLTTATLVASGCDDGSRDEGFDATDVQFRDHDDRDGPDKLNTSHIDDDDLIAVSSLPRAEGAVSGVEILEIRSDHCTNNWGFPINGEFTTAVTEDHLELSLATTGHLGQIRMTKVDNPFSYCTLSGNQWENTEWEIRVTNGNDVIETDLVLADITDDDDGYALYRWNVNRFRVDPDFGGEILYGPICAEDISSTAVPGLEFHAYLFKDLHVNDVTGDFSTAADTMYIACLSSAVGKSSQWHYKPDTGLHELATRMVRADYCGNGTPHTEIGTMIWLEDDDFYDEPVPSGYTVEAAWDLSTGKATCVTMPRLTGSFDGTCGGQPVSGCGTTHLIQSEINTYVP